MGTNKPYNLQEIPGKDLGPVAVAKIAKGTRILFEEPLLTVPQSKNTNEKRGGSLAGAVAALSEDKQQAFSALHDA